MKELVILGAGTMRANQLLIKNVVHLTSSTHQ